MAATATVYIAVSLHNQNAASAAQKFASAHADDRAKGINDLINLLAMVASGAEAGRVYVAVDNPSGGTAGTFTVTCTQANATNGETVTVLGVTFTLVTTASADPRSGQIEAGADDTEMGDNLAAAINAHPLLKPVISAANAAGVVTCTFRDKGLFGNLGVAAETGDAFAVAQPTNGAEGTLSASLRAFAVGV